MPNKTKLQVLPVPAKVSITKAMREYGKTYNEIADILGVNQRTAKQYMKAQTPDQWQNYQQNVRTLISTQEDKLLASVISKLKNDLPEAKYNDAVEVYKTMKETKKQAPVLLQGDNMSVDFIATN